MADLAEKKVRRARSAMLRGVPQGRGAFFGQLAMRLELEAYPALKAPMATNGRVLRYHPTVIEKLPFDQVVGIVAHEVLHLCAGHHVRRGKRDPELWNLACDEAINGEIVEAGFTIPKEAHPDPRFKGMSAERIYTILEAEAQNNPKQKGKGKGGGKGKPDPEAWGGQVDDMPRDEPEKGESEDENKDNGDQDGDNQRPISSEERDTEEREWKMAAAQAAAHALQQGSMPAYAERFLKELHRPKVDPWALLREFCKETIPSDYSWSPPSRRFIAQELYFPALRSEDAMGDMVVIVDTSGSIDVKTLQEFGGHIKAIAEDFKPQSTTVIYADAAVNHVDRFTYADEIKMKPYGGGGTDFRPAFKYIDKKLENPPVVVVYLTDGYGSFPNKDPGYPVVWAMTTDVKAPWGQTIHIKI